MQVFVTIKNGEEIYFVIYGEPIPNKGSFSYLIRIVDKPKDISGVIYFDDLLKTINNI